MDLRPFLFFDTTYGSLQIFIVYSFVLHGT